MDDGAVSHSSSTPWTHHRVRAILTNLKYKGSAVYGRVSKRLHTPEVKTPQESWIVVPNAYSPVVDEPMYAAAERTLAGRTFRKTNDQLVAELGTILATHGKLSMALIRQAKGATPGGSYRRRFGSLERAYELAGYRMPAGRNVRTRSRLQQAQRQVIQHLVELFPQRISVMGAGRQRPSLRIDGKDTVIVRACCTFKTAGDQSRWRIRSEASDAQFVRLLALMDCKNETASRLVLLPPLLLPQTIDVSADSRLLKLGCTVAELTTFLEVLETLPQHSKGSTWLDSKFLRASKPQRLRSGYVCRATGSSPDSRSLTCCSPLQ